MGDKEVEIAKTFNNLSTFYCEIGLNKRSTDKESRLKIFSLRL